MRVIILAAGYGTRLYPLTLNLPKPLIPIKNKPIINFLLDKIDELKQKHTIEQIKVVSNNKFYKKFLAWQEKYAPAVEILNDGSNHPADRLGAVRDIKFAVGKEKGDWLVLGGDNLFQDGLLEFMAFTQQADLPCIGLCDIGDRRLASHYGIVKIDRQNKIVDFAEKPKNPGSTLAATCVYFFPQSSLWLLDLFLAEGHQTDAAGEYIKWLADKTEVRGYVFKNRWFDIGGQDSLKSAQKEFSAA